MKNFVILTIGMNLLVAVSTARGKLIAYFPMDEGSGRTITDTVSLTAGHWAGAESWVEGRFGTAADFRGGSHIAVDFNADYLVTKGSLSAWLKPEDNGGGKQVAQIPFDDGAGWDNPWTSLGIFQSGNQHVRGHTNSNGDYRDTGGFAPSPGAFGEWHHAVVTNDGNEMKLYYDNVLAGALALPHPGGDIHYGGEPQLAIGERSVTALGEPFTGAVDDVALYDHALTATEVETLFMGPAGTEFVPPTEVSWRGDKSGDWNQAGNWSPGFVPDSSLGGQNAAINSAIFGDAITSPKTVYTNSDVSVTQVTFLNANKYAIAGTGSVNFVTNSVAPKIDVFVGDHEFQTDVSVGSDMSVTVGAGTSLTFDNSLNLNGNTLTKSGPGTLNINNNVVSGAGGTIDCQGGNCAGSGTIGGNLSNNSLVSPGNSPGILSVDGNFTQSAGGTLEIELVSNGGVAGTDHDRLAVTLAASLDGTLDLQLDGGYSPTIGDSFAGIVTAGTVSGSFATTNNVVIDGRQGVAVTYTETAVNAQIGLRGNTDIASGDIDVDTSDLTTSIINFTSAGGTGKTWADGDMDGDGDVDTSDLTTSIIHFTSALSSGSAAVPEPTSFVLLSLGMVLLLGRSRARR